MGDLINKDLFFSIQCKEGNQEICQNLASLIHTISISVIIIKVIYLRLFENKPYYYYYYLFTLIIAMSKASHVEGFIPLWAKQTVGILLFTNMLSPYYLKLKKISWGCPLIYPVLLNPHIGHKLLSSTLQNFCHEIIPKFLIVIQNSA